MSEGIPQSAPGPESIESVRTENEALKAEVAALKAEVATERAAKEEALKKLEEAGFDTLTALPMRGRFESIARPLFARPLGENETPRTGEPLPERIAFIFIDIDLFKEVNDTHGHPVGDQILRAFADGLKAQIRPTDSIARWGGEEMVILLPGATAEAAAARAEKLREHVAALPFTDSASKTFNVTASFGVAAMENDGSATLEELTSRADQALYEAKGEAGDPNGRNRVATFSESVAS